jgi:hypothetical protein
MTYNGTIVVVAKGRDGEEMEKVREKESREEVKQVRFNLATHSTE